MGEMNKSFPPTIPSSIVTFDFGDFVESTGFVDFNCFTSEDDSSESFQLLRQTVGSSSTDTSGRTDEGNDDLDFDLSPFTKPVILRGTATTTIPLLMNGVATGVRDWHFVIKVIKVAVGGAETVLVTTTSQTITQTNTASVYTLFNLRSVIPRELFGIGETLRLNVVLVGSIVSGNVGLASWGHDPLNRDGTADNQVFLVPSTNSAHTTKMNFFCPFEAEQ